LTNDPTDDEPGGDIIELRRGNMLPEGMPGPGESPVERTSSRGCQHHGVLVDAQERRVECKRCHAVVDPFDHLLQLADLCDKLSGWVRHARRTRINLEGRVAALKREEKLAKARLARARASLADIGES